MADIYLARSHDSLGGARLVVVKEILPSLSGDPGFGGMLSAEAKLAAQLNHANVVQVFDLGREEGRLYIAMEYVEGFDLNQLLRNLSRARIALPAEFALFIVHEVLRGLDYAHRARDAEGRPLRVVHRDVSPSNVLISFEGEVKLCDFGIARALGRSDEEHEGRVERSRVAGKSAYMAPEHARGDEIDSRADIFAVGILLWELCAGRRLYRGTDEEMLAQARAGDVPVLPDRGLPAHAALQMILDRALAYDPDDRYQTAHELLDDLEEYAIAHGLMASQLRFGGFLTDNFAEEIVRLRREREVAAQPPAEAEDQTQPTLESPPAASNDGELDGEDAAERARRLALANAPTRMLSTVEVEDEPRAKWPLLAVGIAVAVVVAAYLLT
jgi:serine/threonine-protein kinase